MNDRKVIVNTFLGQLKGRVKAKARIIRCIKRAAWGDKAKRLYVALTDDGSCITFNSLGNLRVGEDIEIEGTVSGHKSFCGRYQTHIKNWLINQTFEGQDK